MIVARVALCQETCHAATALAVAAARACELRVEERHGLQAGSKAINGYQHHDMETHDPLVLLMLMMFLMMILMLVAESACSEPRP